MTTSGPKRAPTESAVKVDPSIEIHKTLHPYFNMKQDGLTPYFDAFKRSIASFNPFAQQQLPTSDLASVGIRNGLGYYYPDAYPNTIHFDQAGPSHYNPFADVRRKWKYGVKHATNPGDELSLRPVMLPRFCQRTIQTYKRCMVANDDRSDVCENEQQNILAICPQFAIDGLRQKKLSLMKIEAQNNKLLKDSLVVADYNEGRTVANVARRTWKDGTGANLRSDSMWTDDRYVDITQEEINEAKKRVQQRNEARGVQRDEKLHFEKYDRTYEKPPQPSLYP